MAQTLLIGLGGTGSRVVNNVVKELRLNKKEINNGELCCAVMDTNISDNESINDSGTGIPVICTSAAKKIRNYFEDYHHFHMETWCPQSPAFLEQSMIDGASELRLKSRIAFMDCLESDVIEQLESLLNDVLNNTFGSKIRIMIVSSLSGGTGSGMFIQVALWLRKFFSESEITIRGIFLLPDVFVSTLKDIRTNKDKKVRHYCNAYAAIRELNTITKIKKGNAVDLSEKIAIGDLFDSIRDKDSGKSVYDFAFFIDDRDERGVRLKGIAEYEKMVAQLVYMQLYAPMKDDMYSEEDNFFLPFESNPEPLYGSCGTSKAVYPTDSVKAYCAIRALQDSLTSGWKKIDDEIDALIDEKKQDERDGIWADEIIDKRTQYIKIFDDKIAVKAEDAGKDRFFISISKDVKNETKKKQDNGKVGIKYSDKVADFVKLLNRQKIDTFITEHGGTDDYAINADDFVRDDHSKGELIDKANSDKDGLEEVLDVFDSKVEEYANTIVNSVFPYSMGDVNASNRCTIYGLLTKENEMGQWDFIHPVAARYVLYKLVENMQRTLGSIVLTTSRENAMYGGDVATLFDNEATPEITEVSPEELLNSRKWYQSEHAFLDSYERKYAQFITTKIALCETYEKECLQVSVYRKLIERVNGLIEKLEMFFKRLEEVQKKLTNDLTENVNATAETVGKILYVCGGKEDKEAIYKSLDFDLDKGNARINKSVIDTIYGCYCAEKRPSNNDNSAYKNVGVITAFVKEAANIFKKKIDDNENNSRIVDMDIYTALCKECDTKYEKNNKNANEDDDINDFDIMTGEVKIDNTTAIRHKAAFAECKKRLLSMAAPFLIHDKEVSKHPLGITTSLSKTFWGFNPAVLAAHSFVGAELGINADIQSDSAYPRNELQCYNAIYGLEAKYIPKFNELSGGDYFTCYSAVVDEMVKDASGNLGARAFVRTPHLDMNWHRILPYISEEKQKQVEEEFFHGFWLAVAYGLLTTDKNGNIYIRRSVDGVHGNYTDDVAVMHKGRHLTKTDVVKLIEALKADKIFTSYEIPILEERFADEIEDLVTYVGTDVLKGLTTNNDDMNSVNVVARYNESLGRDKRVSDALVEALERIAGELAKKYNAERSESQIEEAKYKICKKIYDSSKRTKGKSEIFRRWKEAFERFEIKEDDSTSDSSK